MSSFPIHVRYIYPPLAYFYGKFVGKYTIFPWIVLGFELVIYVRGGGINSSNLAQNTQEYSYSCRCQGSKSIGL